MSGEGAEADHASIRHGVPIDATFVKLRREDAERALADWRR